MRVWIAVALVACSGAGTAPTDRTETAPVQEFVLSNSGDADREGHTPRGFMGQGGGLFVGDDLNASFPEGDGVQAFLSFNIGRSSGGALAEGGWTVRSAVLASEVDPEIEGTPFEDLGDLVADEVVFDEFSSALWNLAPPPGAAQCVFSDGPAGGFACDLAGAVQHAIDDGRRWVNARLSFEAAGDSDGVQDMVFFFRGDVNATERDLFSLTVEAAPTD